jgi:hypothetical protein
MRQNSRTLDRIALFIEEFQELELYCTQIEDTLARADMAAFQSLPPRPISRAMLEEKYRMKIYGPRAQANREYMRRRRALVQPSISKAQQDKDYDDRLVTELKERQKVIAKEQEEFDSRKVDVDLTPDKFKLGE